MKKFTSASELPAMAASFYAGRRAKLFAALKKNSVAVVVSSPERTRSNDTEHSYRQSSDVLYLSGFAEAESVLVFSNIGGKDQFIMFVRPKDRKSEIWTGIRAGVDGAKGNFGADAAHTVDLFQYQTGEQASIANAVQGPIHPDLGIAMDMSIQLRTGSGKICTLSLSFNNDGPLGTFFRYICDNGTWIARYDDLVTGKEEPVDVSKVDVSMNGIELQDREFVAAIREGREPNASVAQVLPCYRVLDALEKQLRG